MTVREVLIEARRLIAEVGWCQGQNIRKEPDGTPTGYCMVGAIATVAFAHNGYGKTAPLIEALSREVYGNPDSQVSLWNDAPGRTKAEVLEAFDRAIEGCET